LEQAGLLREFYFLAAYPRNAEEPPASGGALGAEGNEETDCRRFNDVQLPSRES